MKIVGHRGARDLAPENTIASLKKALHYNVDQIEFDLRVTKDGVVILHHDDELHDPNGSRLAIRHATYAALKAHKPDLATFEEALDTVKQSVPLYVEVKPKVSVAPIVKIIETYLAQGWKQESFLLGSKSQRTLVELHTALPTIQKIVIEPWSGLRATYRARQVETKLLSMNKICLWSGYIRAVTKRGYKLYAYTLNSPKKAAKWQKHGLYGVVTDYPDRFRA